MSEGTVERPKWATKAAIRWASTSSSSSSSCCDSHHEYWDEELLVTLSKLTTDQIQTECWISYESLMLAALVLARQLRKLVRSELMCGLHPWPLDGDSVFGVPIAVAIPEGPYLPLGILAVHLLNEPSSPIAAPSVTTSHCQYQFYGVLVPLEPTEGKDRLLHMLNDARPALILAMPGADWDRVERIVANSRSSSTKTTRSDERNDPVLIPTSAPPGRFSLYRASCPTLLNLKTLLCDGMMNMERQGGSDCRHLRDVLQRALSKERNSVKSPIQILSDMERQTPCDEKRNRVSHIVYTSGTTGDPKGCVSSVKSLRSYLLAKNRAHGISDPSTVLLASALSFDPCLSDVLASFDARATLAIAPRRDLLQNLPSILRDLDVTHVLCTPTLWGMVHNAGMTPHDFPVLRVVALGGEPIPRRLVQTWARMSSTPQRTSTRPSSSNGLRLCSTYGVTEACVYQTFGEVFRSHIEHTWSGQNTGLPLHGLHILIQAENYDKENSEQDSMRLDQAVGEIVLYGSQVDECAGYLNRPDLTSSVFVPVDTCTSAGDSIEEQSCIILNTQRAYRTGDRGYLKSTTGRLHVIGRIGGEDGMVKVNGVRVELGEIETVLVDRDISDSANSVVVDCLAVVVHAPGDDGNKQIHGFCVLSDECLREIGIWNHPSLETGVLVTSSPLYSVLRVRARDGIRAGAMPAAFVLVSRIPMSPTGKRDRRLLPSLDHCELLGNICGSRGLGSATLLSDYGFCGAIVSEQIVECLNLQPCQQGLLTTAVDFAMLGGDSLAATRVVRSLYAYHYEVPNSRFLGGEYGQLNGPFAVKHLMKAQSLGDYVDMLDRLGVRPKSDGSSHLNGHSSSNESTEGDSVVTFGLGTEKNNESIFFETLLETCTLNQSTIAMSLLDLGADPNFGAHGGRLGKTSSRNERKQQFRSNPLHLACSHGSSRLVAKLIGKGCRFNSPDATGSFPMHLAASGRSTKPDVDHSSTQEDLCRLECVKLLLEAGAPLSMKDGNKQTVLHSAARGGHCRLIEFLMGRWKQAMDRKEIQGYGKQYKSGKFDWLDRWGRSPVHWAVLNGHEEALQVLIRGGCSPDPPQVVTGRSTSVAMESPMEICMRLYGESDGLGARMVDILSSRDGL